MCSTKSFSKSISFGVISIFPSGPLPQDPFDRVKALQAAFDPSALEFSDEYYDTLGLENPRHPEEENIIYGSDVAATQVFFTKREDAL